MDALTRRELVDRVDALEVLNARLEKQNQQLWGLNEEVERENKQLESINKDLEKQNPGVAEPTWGLISYFHLTLGFLVCLIFFIWRITPVETEYP